MIKEKEELCASCGKVLYGDGKDHGTVGSAPLVRGGTWFCNLDCLNAFYGFDTILKI